MKVFSIAETNKLYRHMKHCRIHEQVVYHQTLQKLCNAIRDIENNLGEHAQEEFWQEILLELRKFRFILYAAPIPINFQLRNIIHLLKSSKKNCELLFPSSVLRLQIIIDTATELLDTPDNPMLERILELVLPESSSKIAILLKETYLVSIVEEIIKTNPVLQNVELVNKYQLRGIRCYQKLFVIGPHYWFPNYIFRTPRTEEVYYLRYSWIPDTWVKKPIFIEPVSHITSTDTTTKSAGIGDAIHKNTSERREDLEQEKVPEINWHKLSAKVLKSTLDDHTQETVLAKLYLLAKDQAVFLEASENAKVHVLDFETNEGGDEEEDTQQIKRIPINKLQPGMFILLRTGGGGDYIIPIANRILGEMAVKYRDIQEQWKTLLKKEVDVRGLLAVCIDLLDYGGSKHVNETNLRYWISSRNIRPQDDKDFSAIMKLVGLQDKAMLYQEVANKIETAHRKAGFHIRKLLIKQIATTNLHEIHKKGYMEFELLESDGGSLTAFRIEHISPNSSTIPASRIGHPVLAKDY